MNVELFKEKIISVPINFISWEETLAVMHSWAHRNESKYVCIVNVHSLVSARHDSDYFRVIAQADIATPDGAPVAWMLRRYGHKGQVRINGPDLMWRYLQHIDGKHESVFLYGSTDSTLEILENKIRDKFPNVIIAGKYAPPFRSLTEEESDAVVRLINASGAGTVWVSLGCPKQEFWMARQRGRINAVMIGVGAAFDFHSGVVNRAPQWMREKGLEWFFRLCQEPGRLWKRYLISNSLFVVEACLDLINKWARKN